MTPSVVFVIMQLLIRTIPEPWRLGEGGVFMYQYLFADNLCRLCKEKHISVNELADAIEKSPRQVNRYRNGQCENLSLCTIAKIAKVLDVSIAELFDEDFPHQ